MSMFCYQCEQVAKGEACTATGVCGKHSDVAAMQAFFKSEVTNEDNQC